MSGGMTGAKLKVTHVNVPHAMVSTGGQQCMTHA